MQLSAINEAEVELARRRFEDSRNSRPAWKMPFSFDELLNFYSIGMRPAEVARLASRRLKRGEKLTRQSVTANYHTYFKGLLGPLSMFPPPRRERIKPDFVATLAQESVIRAYHRKGIMVLPVPAKKGKEWSRDLLQIGSEIWCIKEGRRVLEPHPEKKGEHRYTPVSVAMSILKKVHGVIIVQRLSGDYKCIATRFFNIESTTLLELMEGRNFKIFYIPLNKRKGLRNKPTVLWWNHLGLPSAICS